MLELLSTTLGKPTLALHNGIGVEAQARQVRRSIRTPKDCTICGKGGWDGGVQ